MGEVADYEADTLEALPAGAPIGGYAIRRIIGHGGFGITYEAHNRVTGKEVAIKEFFPSSMVRRDGQSRLIYSKVNAETITWALRKFEETTTTLCGLSHPNIVQVHDYVPTNDTGYMIMELLDGQTLEQRLAARAAPPTLDELRPIVDPVMRALDYVHGRGLIHRDIAPDNILITRQGRPVLIDFGSVSRDLSDARRKALSSTVGVAKRHYTAPEQTRAKARPTPEADIYSMGAVLYRALNGAAPVDGQDRLDALFGKTADPYAPLMKRLPPGCPARAAGAIDTALAVRAEERLHKIADLSVALAAPASASVAPTPPARWLAAAALAVVLAVLGGAVAGSRLATNGDRAVLDREREELARDKANLDHARDAQTQVQSDITKQRGELEAARAEIARRSAAAEAATADIAKQRSDLESAKADSDHQGASMQAIKSDIDRQRKELRQAGSDLEQEKQTLQVAQADLVQQRDRLSAEKSRLDQDRAQLGQGARDEVERLTRQLNDARTSADDAERKRSAAEADAAQQRGRAQSAATENDQLRAQLGDKDEKLATLTSENGRLYRVLEQAKGSSTTDDSSPPAKRETYERRSTSCTVHGLDPAGNNWLALRTEPSFKATWSSTRMGPGTVVSAFGGSGEWRHVRLQSGETGWANSRFLACGDGGP